jgi:hypothetical protein
MQAPAPLAAKQWHTVLTVGGGFGIPLALTSAIATAYAAYLRIVYPLSSSDSC